MFVTDWSFTLVHAIQGENYCYRCLRLLSVDGIHGYLIVKQFKIAYNKPTC